MGYHRAGFDVYGVDLNPQPRYPFMFRQDDALAVLRALCAGARVQFVSPTGGTVEHLALSDFAGASASPPCQRYTVASHLSDIDHPDLLPATRAALVATGLPYVIENVPGAPMRDFVTLCGSEFGLVARDVDGELVQLRRHRQFESNVWLWGAGGCQHLPGVPTASVFGHGGGWSVEARESPMRRKGYVPHKTVCAALLGIDWPMRKPELSESIPPAYTEWIGRQVMEAII